MRKLKTETVKGTRLSQLKTLANVLAVAIDNCDDIKTLPQLAKQYRETIREIETIEGAVNHGDEIGEILARRQADGKPGAVRADRTRLSCL